MYYNYNPTSRQMIQAPSVCLVNSVFVLMQDYRTTHCVQDLSSLYSTHQNS